MKASMSQPYSEDLDIARSRLSALPVDWEGRACVLELKKANHQWRQMEWAGFYFQYLCENALRDEFEIPGERFGSTTFDAQRNLNWDFKWHAIKAHDHRCILNDVSAMKATIRRWGEYGVVVGLSDVEYNDDARTFQRWHTALKGGLSKYERDRQARTAVSRYRKTRAVLVEVLFLRIAASDLPLLDRMRQGRNSNGAPRPEKYMLDLEHVDPFLADRIPFGSR